jgi:hypothetical protein
MFLTYAGIDAKFWGTITYACIINSIWPFLDHFLVYIVPDMEYVSPLCVFVCVCVCACVSLFLWNSFANCIYSLSYPGSMKVYLIWQTSSFTRKIFVFKIVLLYIFLSWFLGGKLPSSGSHFYFVGYIPRMVFVSQVCCNYTLSIVVCNFASFLLWCVILSWYIVCPRCIWAVDCYTRKIFWSSLVSTDTEVI